jgi:hypothetical protein
MWAADIKLAHESGFDGFALNLGTDSWQIKQLGSAYDTATAYGPSFKLFSQSPFALYTVIICYVLMRSLFALSLV